MADTATKVANFTIDLTLKGKTLTTVGPDLISQWISVDEDAADGPALFVDLNAIQKWSYDNLNSIVNGEDEETVWEVNSWEVAQELGPRLAAANSDPMEIPTVTMEERPPRPRATRRAVVTSTSTCQRNTPASMTRTARPSSGVPTLFLAWRTASTTRRLASLRLATRT